MSSSTKTTAVDGLGMWRSWTRVFAQPESACWDLLDNCFDAATNAGGTSGNEEEDQHQGKVILEEVSLVQSTTSYLCVQNNSAQPVAPLSDVLTIYQSQKNKSGQASVYTPTPTTIKTEQQQQASPLLPSPLSKFQKDSIGENGVGLKHGCAALSDCSLVITRNHQTVQVGVIAQALQSTAGVYLPHTTFDYNNATAAIQQWLTSNPDIATCLQTALQTRNPSLASTVEAVVQLVVRTRTPGHWQTDDYVFLLVICQLKKFFDKSHVLIQSSHSVPSFLQTVKTRLPVHYINLPTTFDLKVNAERVDFSYWPRRLVELTRFTVHVSPTVALEALPDQTWYQPTDDKHTLSIYCGFDAQRMDEDIRRGQGTSTCYLYIYSCEAGRLIRHERDARYMLGLSSSGVDYTQGLTVIINDHRGTLPLTPTKDGIAWSERAHGEVFERNLWAWTGAVAQCFWKEYFNFFNSSKVKHVKELMKKTIHSYVQDQKDLDPSVRVPQNLEKAQLKTFVDLTWTRHQKVHGTHWTIRRTGAPTITFGPDTLFPITRKRIQEIKGGGKPRKSQVATTIPRVLPESVDKSPNNGAAAAHYTDIHHRNGTHDDRIDDDDDDEEGPIPTLYHNGNGVVNVDDMQEDEDWAEIDPKHIPRVTHTLLNYLRDMTGAHLFEDPVIETYPQLKEQYLEKVPRPMDFATIERKRLPQYTAVTQLQQDLILTFQNCIRFNGEDSPYAEIANAMLGSLDEAYKNILLGKRLRKQANRFIAQKIDQYNTSTNKRQKISSSESSPKNASGRGTVSLQAKLKTERAKVAKLEKLLAERDARIQELELMLPEGIRTTNTTNLTRYVPTTTATTTTAAAAAAATRGATPLMSFEEGCEICKKNDNHHVIILCDNCDREYHTYCLTPPLSEIPTGEWYCPHCISIVPPAQGPTTTTAATTPRGSPGDNSWESVVL
jgi:hypothetical protein